MSPASPVRDARRETVARLRAAGCVFAEDEARILHDAATSAGNLAAMLERRVHGEPLEHVVGWAEFDGLRIAVDPGVFVPRRRTEFLVRQAASRCRPGGVVVDVCCGSGAVGLALATALGGRVELHATDVDPVAVGCARRNLAAIGARVYEGDLDAPLPDRLAGRVDVMVANVPYVPQDEIALMPPEARLHEPSIALDGGTDGLEVLRRLAARAPRWLIPRGHLLVETSERQAEAAAEAIARNGLTPTLETSDELGTTILIGSRDTD
jgi:release factor glutamine methyltransferase